MMMARSIIFYIVYISGSVFFVYWSALDAYMLNSLTRTLT